MRRLKHLGEKSVLNMFTENYVKILKTFTTSKAFGASMCLYAYFFI